MSQSENSSPQRVASFFSKRHPHMADPAPAHSSAPTTPNEESLLGQVSRRASNAIGSLISTAPMTSVAEDNKDDIEKLKKELEAEKKSNDRMSQMLDHLQTEVAEQRKSAAILASAAANSGPQYDYLPHEPVHYAIPGGELAGEFLQVEADECGMTSAVAIIPCAGGLVSANKKPNTDLWHAGFHPYHLSHLSRCAC